MTRPHGTWRGGVDAVVRASRVLSAYGWAAVSLAAAVVLAAVAMTGGASGL